MKILFVSSLSYYPQYYCGANFSIDQRCTLLKAKGHDVDVLVSLRPGGLFATFSRVKAYLRKLLTGYGVARDRRPGYPVWRAWVPSEVMDYVVHQTKPDVIVVVAGAIVPLALAAKKANVPICMFVTDVEFQFHGGDFAQLGSVPCVANSRFTADTYFKKFGLTSDVIFPTIIPEKYLTATSRKNVTFINPHPEKGVDLAIEIARLCPEIPFSFYKTWFLNDTQSSALSAKLSHLPNVTLHEARDDLKTVYGDCKVLLAPSIWEETYGRVVTEAQFSGIPAITSNRGGLPEAVGPGGVVLDPTSDVGTWVSALRKLWYDDAYYAELSKAAVLHAYRPELTVDHQILKIEQIFHAISHRSLRGEVLTAL